VSLHRAKNRHPCVIKLSRREVIAKAISLTEGFIMHDPMLIETMFISGSFFTIAMAIVLAIIVLERND